MATRALFRNKVWLLAFAAAAVCSLLLLYVPGINKPVHVNAASSYLRQSRGVLYYQGLPFSGVTDAFYADGKTIAACTPYSNGRQNGLMQSWYSNGQLQQQRYFNKGKKQGLHKGWWPNGKPKFEYNFNGGEHHGSAKEWFANGRLYRYFNYNNGHEEGRQQMWWYDGKVRANYVLKNGEQFGLVGRKLCENALP